AQRLVAFGVEAFAGSKRGEPGGLNGGVPGAEAQLHRLRMGPQRLLPAPLHLGPSLGRQRLACHRDVPVVSGRPPPVAAVVLADRLDDRLAGPEGAVPESAGPAPLGRLARPVAAIGRGAAIDALAPV